MEQRLQIPGIVIGPKIGRGEHSVVYRATFGQRPCALKVLSAKSGWTRWAYRDALALARVRNPGLPRVLELGQVEGAPYVAVELIVGESLEQRLQLDPLEEVDALGVLMDVVEALGAIHDAGLVHRDVTPRNIILEPSGRVRLVDFGFFRWSAERPDVVDARSLRYAAPELLDTSALADGRADLYAAGQVLADCLEALTQAKRASPQRTSGANDLVEQLKTITSGLRSQDPDKRYPDARALLAELDRVRKRKPVRGPAAYSATRKRVASLVGREPELSRLVRAWEGVAAQGVGSVVLVEGVRGGGKTSLLAGLTQAAVDSGVGRVLSLACRYGDPPLALLRRMLEAYLGSIGQTAGRDRAADEAALRASAPGYLAGFATLIAPKLATLLGDDGSSVEPAPGGFPEGVAELVSRLARAAGPLLLSVDDVQWIDPISRQVLVRVAERVSSAALLLVLSSRARDKDGSLSFELDPKRTLRVELGPLDDAGVEELVAAHLGEDRTNPELARRVSSLADGTPLGVLEVLGAMLDLGALCPRDGAWAVDAERLSHIALPEGSLSLLRGRLAEVPRETRKMLEVASVLGTQFDDATLARMLGLTSEELQPRLAEARRAGIVEGLERGSHGFVHDSAREMLADGIAEPELRALHAEVADRLDAVASSAEDHYAVAAHYGAGDLSACAPRAYHAARRAARSAIQRFDNETALRFLELARRAAGVAAIALDAAFHRDVGEACLRLGALVASREAFDAALEAETDPLARGSILGRISWVEQARGDPDRAWTALVRAFEAVGARMPDESIRSAAGAIQVLVARQVGRFQRRKPLTNRAHAKAELVCELHFQNARLGLEYGKPQRLVGSAIAGLRVSETLGKSRSQVRSLSSYGLVLASLGFRGAGARALSRAESMASELRDPTIVARCKQSRAVCAAFAGEVDSALALMRECVDLHAPLLEATDYLFAAITGELLESVRGRSDEAWAWVAKAVEHQRRSNRRTAVFDEVVLHRARSCLASLGRTAEPGSWLATELERAERAGKPEREFHRGLYWAARARALVDEGHVGEEFEALVQAFGEEGHDPRKVHLTVIEYYVAVAHGRVHQLLLASPAERRARLASLETACSDLVASARLPLWRGHALFVQGVVAAYQGKKQEAARFFGDAEALATEENAPWVLYAVARVRAHRLRDEGKLHAALDQARFAELLARQHGAEPRARCVREEFALPSRAADETAAGRETSVHRAERGIAALLRLTRAPELRPEQQAGVVLADLLRDLDADRGFTLFQPDGATGPRLWVERNRQGDESSQADAWRERWLETIRDTGQAWPPQGATEPVVAAGRRLDPMRLLASPLMLGDAAIGATCLERSPGAPPFSADERELFLLVARQTPVALEMAHLFVEREQLHASLRQAQKMEAVGQLAGGIAHDFNNMLTVIQASLASVRRKVDSEREVAGDIGIIADATQRAGRLMRQLLGFSRHQAATPRLCVVNDLIAELLPMLQKLAGDRIKVVLQLDPDVDDVMLVRASFDQAMVNLVVNARDAMPGDGSISIVTKEVTLDEVAVREGALRAGRHVRVQITDTGSGIAPDHIHQVFDPFFTTKEAGSGTGLGLTTVYAFVRNSGGHVELESTVGRGTVISLYFPVAEREGVSVGSVDDRRYASLS